MRPDLGKVEDAVLALLAHFASEDRVSWRNCEFSVMNSFFERGLIDDPRNKNKSVRLSEEGLRRGKELAAALFFS